MLSLQSFRTGSDKETTLWMITYARSSYSERRGEDILITNKSRGKRECWHCGGDNSELCSLPIVRIFSPAGQSGY